MSPSNTVSLGLRLTPYQVASWSIQLFGHNKYGPKIGEGSSAPFWGGGAGSPSNTVWPGPRPTCMPSFILIRPTVWPQYTNVSDRQTADREHRANRFTNGRRKTAESSPLTMHSKACAVCCTQQQTIPLHCSQGDRVVLGDLASAIPTPVGKSMHAVWCSFDIIVIQSTSSLVIFLCYCRNCLGIKWLSSAWLWSRCGPATESSKYFPANNLNTSCRHLAYESNVSVIYFILTELSFP